MNSEDNQSEGIEVSEEKSGGKDVATESKLVWDKGIKEIFEGESYHKTWGNSKSGELRIEVSELVVRRIVEKEDVEERTDEIFLLGTGELFDLSGRFSDFNKKSSISYFGDKTEVSELRVRVDQSKDGASGFEDGWNNFAVLGGIQKDGENFEKTEFFLEVHLEKDLFEELVGSIKAKEISNLTISVDHQFMRGLFSDDAYEYGSYFKLKYKYLWNQAVEGLKSGSELEEKMRAKGFNSVEADRLEHLRTGIVLTYKNRFESEIKNDAEIDEEVDGQIQQEQRQQEAQKENEEQERKLEEMKLFKTIKAILWLIFLVLLATLFF